MSGVGCLLEAARVDRGSELQQLGVWREADSSKPNFS